MEFNWKTATENRNVVIAALLLLLAGCAADDPSVNAPTPAPHVNQDSINIVTPPAADYQTSIAGTWRCERRGGNNNWYATYVIAGRTMHVDALSVGQWSPTIDLRIDGQRVWWEAYPLPFPGNYATFNGTMAADSIVGRMMVWTKALNGARLPQGDSLWALTFRRQ